MKSFTLTKDHIKLLQRMYIHEEDNYYGSPTVDAKRPYGNGYIAGDIGEILGWKWNEEDGLTSAQEDKAHKIHRETVTALQIVLCTKSFKPGVYVRTSEYSATSWKLQKPVVKK